MSTASGATAVAESAMGGPTVAESAMGPTVARNAMGSTVARNAMGTVVRSGVGTRLSGPTTINFPPDAMYTVQRNIQDVITNARDAMVKDVATAKESIDKTQRALTTALSNLDRELATLRQYAPPPASGPVPPRRKRFLGFGGRRASRKGSRKASRRRVSRKH